MSGNVTHHVGMICTHVCGVPDLYKVIGVFPTTMGVDGYYIQVENITRPWISSKDMVPHYFIPLDPPPSGRAPKETEDSGIVKLKTLQTLNG